MNVAKAKDLQAYKGALAYLGAGLGVSFLLFLLMAHLVSGGKGSFEKSDPTSIIDFVRLKNNDDINTRQRRLPKKPPKVKKVPSRPKTSLAKMNPNQKAMAMKDIPKLDIPLAIGKGPYLGPGGGQLQDSDVMPLVRIEPRYPRKAAMEGKEGWVMLEFGINEVGQTYNVRVVDSKPRRLFDREARRALLKWKYRPRLQEGKAVAMEGFKVRIDFNLGG